MTTTDRIISAHRLDADYAALIIDRARNGRRLVWVAQILEPTEERLRHVDDGILELVELAEDNADHVVLRTPAYYGLGTAAAITVREISIDYGAGWTLPAEATARLVRIARLEAGEADRIPDGVSPHLLRLAAEVDEMDRAATHALPCGAQDAHHDATQARAGDLLEAIETELARISDEVSTGWEPEVGGRAVSLGYAERKADELFAYARDLEERRGLDV